MTHQGERRNNTIARDLPPARCARLQGARRRRRERQEGDTASQCPAAALCGGTRSHPALPPPLCQLLPPTATTTLHEHPKQTDLHYVVDTNQPQPPIHVPSTAKPTSRTFARHGPSARTYPKTQARQTTTQKLTGLQLSEASVPCVRVRGARPNHIKLHIIIADCMQVGGNPRFPAQEK
jgi:hypothetical protein